MSDVHRYNVVTMLSSGGNTIGYDPHGPEVVMASEFDRVSAERDGLQQRLNAADQRIDELTAQRAPAAFPGYPPVNPDRQQPFTEQFIEDHLGKLPLKS